MQAATQLLDAAMPLLGKRGPVDERHENFDTLRTHWLESMNAREPPTATTDEQRSERRVHTKRIEYMRKKCNDAVDLGKNTPKAQRRLLVSLLESVDTTDGLQGLAAKGLQEDDEMDVDDEVAIAGDEVDAPGGSTERAQTPSLMDLAVGSAMDGAREQLDELVFVFGEESTTALVAGLLALPSLKDGVTIADDLSTVLAWWRQRSQENASMRGLRVDGREHLETAARRRVQRLKSALPTHVVEIFLADAPCAAPYPSLLSDLSRAPMALDYSDDPLLRRKLTFERPFNQIDANEKLHEQQPVPFGSVVYHKGDAAFVAIPTEWPLIVAPEQIVCSAFVSPPSSPYMLDDVQRGTLISEIMTDMGAFLRGHQVACLPGGPTLVRHDPDGCLTELSPSWRADDPRADLFNLGAGASREPTGRGATLLVSTLPFSELKRAWEAPEADTPPPPLPPEHADGTRVQIGGLCNLPFLKYNDHEGDIVGYAPEVDRYLVQLLELNQEVIRVRPGNVVPVAPPAAPSPPAAPPAAPPAVPRPQPRPGAPQNGPQLAHVRAFVRQGAGNPRPVAPPHNTVLNNLCGRGVVQGRAESLHLPNRARAFRSLATHLRKAEEQPMRVCYNCGMLNYPTQGDTIAVPGALRSDCRAWNVFEPMICQHARRHQLDPDNNDELNQVFRCQPVPNSPTPRISVFSCGSCKSASARDPAQTDLFDGVGADGVLRPNGIGERLPAAFQELTPEERMCLSVVKMADASFYPAYSNTGYMHFANGGFLQPSDYHGLCTMLVRDEAAPNVNQQRVRAALTRLCDPQFGNPLVRETLTCFERALAARADDAFPADAGAGGLPVMVFTEETMHGPANATGPAAGASPPPPVARAAPPPAGGNGAVRTLLRSVISGTLQTVQPVPGDATLRANAIGNLTVGDRRRRVGGALELQPAVGKDPSYAMAAALHSTLYHTGLGAWHKKEDGTSCDEVHFNKARLASVNPKFRDNPEVSGCKLAHCQRAHSPLPSHTLTKRSGEQRLARRRGLLMMRSSRRRSRLSRAEFHPHTHTCDEERVGSS